MSWSRRAEPLLLALALAACERAAPPVPVVEVPRFAPTLAALGDLEYALIAFDGARVKLDHGRFEASTETPDAERLIESAELHPLSGIGDLDGDGSPDAAVVIAANGGGSGTFYELVVVLNRAGGLAPLPGVVLGDRVKLQRIEVRHGRVHLEYLAAGPDDPLCCPATPVRRDLALNADRLEESAPGAGL